MKTYFNKSNPNLVFYVSGKVRKANAGGKGIQEYWTGTLKDISANPDTATSNYQVRTSAFEQFWVEMPTDSVNVNNVMSDKAITPSAAQQIVTPDSGYNGFAKVTVAGDADLVAENIKAGVVIFGVTGSYPRTGTDILTATVEEQTAALTIDAVAHTIVGTVGSATVLTALAFTFTLSGGATANKVSGADVDFTNPVTVTVTAEDGTTQAWTVTITKAGA